MTPQSQNYIMRTEKLIIGKDNVLQALKLGDPVRLITHIRTEIPDRAWEVYAGVYNVKLGKSVSTDAIRLIRYLGWGNIGQLFFSTNNLVSLEGDLLTFNDYALPSGVSRIYPESPSGAIDYRSQKQYNRDYNLLKQSGVLG